jgi:hypothetical protein
LKGGDVMSDFEKQIILELSKKYVFENFDFKNDSPQNLIKSFQETYNKIETVIEDQHNVIANEKSYSF